MAFGNRHRDTSRIQLNDIEEIQGEVELEKKLLKYKPPLKGKKPITIQNTTFFVPKDEDESVAIKRLNETFANSIL